jgi:hypothetical protein
MRTKYFLISTFSLLAVLLAACGSQATPPASVQGIATTAVPVINTLAASTAAQTAVGAVDTLAASTAVETAAAGAINTAEASTAVQTAVVQDLSTLMAALQASGLTVETGASVTQPFFTVQGQTLTINGQDVQVFAYDTAQARDADAAQISADASTIGNNMPSWTSDPHFYKLGNMILLYVGQDQKILDILSNVLGPQFAGR